ncbi:MAG: hypothetical protein U0354_05155 [Candidatus Sericytochromatia bacterium]
MILDVCHYNIVMEQSEEDKKFFSLLINISASNESSIERLSTTLKVFVKKYFDNKEFNPPSNALEIVMDCIMKSEAILYTVYELEENVNSEDEKIELLYYKDLVLKSMVVLTNLDFFVEVLKKNNLFKDAYLLREKLRKEFIMDAARLGKDTDEVLINIEDKAKLFKDIKPIDYQKTKKDNNVEKQEFIDKENSQKEIIEKEEAKKKLSFLERAKLISKEKNINSFIEEEQEPKKHRTAMGWEISQDLLDKDIYK